MPLPAGEELEDGEMRSVSDGVRSHGCSSTSSEMRAGYRVKVSDGQKPAQSGRSRGPPRRSPLNHLEFVGRT